MCRDEKRCHVRRDLANYYGLLDMDTSRRNAEPNSLHCGSMQRYTVIFDVVFVPGAFACQ